MNLNPALLNKYLTKKNIEQSFDFCFWLLISLSVALISWVIFQSSSLILKTQADISYSEQQAQSAILSNSTQQEVAKEKTDFRTIVNKNFFGPLTQSAVATPVSTNNSANNLKLELIGTFLTDGQAPYAIIENKKDSEQDVFELQDSVFEVAKLIEIKSDEVKIDRNGEIEILRIEDFGSGADAPDAGGGGTLINVNATELDEALNNLPLLLTQARAVPYFKDGVAVGLRLFAIRPGSLFEKIGLKNGDILKTINGNSMADITQAIKLFEKLKEEKKIDLQLERNREEQSFTYVIG